jgi:Tol biopolymer transport system component
MTFAQQVNIGQLTKLTSSDEGKFYHPVFAPDEEKVFFTSEKYKGISYLDLNTREVTQLNNAPGAGYEFTFTDNGSEIIYRKDSYKGMKKYSDLMVQDVQTLDKQMLEEDVRNLSMPAKVNKNKVVYLKNNSLQSFNSEERQINKAMSEQVYVNIENGAIALYKGDSKQVLKPAGEGNYIWPSLSPDKTKLLFTLAGNSTYAYDLQSGELNDLGDAHAPKWSPDGNWIVYMKDKDDGHKITASDIFIKNVNTKKEMKLTSTDGTIEMYPSWAPSQEKVVFNSLKGEIYSLELKFE